MNKKQYEVTAGRVSLVGLRLYSKSVLYFAQMSGSVAKVESIIDFDSREEAKAAFDAIEEHNATDILKQLNVASHLVKELTSALENRHHANTKKATEFSYRTHGSTTNGRFPIRYTAASRIHSKR